MWPPRKKTTGNAGAQRWEPAERMTSISKYLFRAPDPRNVIVPLVIASLVGGLLISPDLDGIVFGILFLALPALGATCSSTWTVKLLGDHFYPRRSVTLALAGVILVDFIILCSIVFRVINRVFLDIGACSTRIDLPWRFVVIYGYSLAFTMRYLTLRASCFARHRHSIVTASQQPLLALALYSSWAVLNPGFADVDLLSARELWFGLLSTMALMAAALFYVDTVNAPLQNEIGIGATDLVNYILRYMAGGTRELEAIFAPMKTSADLPVTVLAVRKRGTVGKYAGTESDSVLSDNMPTTRENTGNQAGRPFKALVIAPAVHPGPMGTMGGGNLPAKLCAALQDAADHILVPHSAATNDFNPSTSGECLKVAETVKELAEDMEFSSDGTSLSPPILSGDGAVSMRYMEIGGGLFLCCMPYPEAFDDISVGAGERIKGAALHAVKRDAPVMVVDAHNHSDRASRTIYTGYPHASALFELAELAGKKASFNRAVPECRNGKGHAGDHGTDGNGKGGADEIEKHQGLKMGFAGIPGKEFGENVGIAECGLRVMVTETGTGKEKRHSALILFDGNNMLPALRSAVLEAAREMVDEAEVLTTDNHFVNATIGGFNPIGMRLGAETVIPGVQKALRRALDDLEPVEAAMRSGTVEGINVIGQGSTTRIVTLINATIAVAKKAFLPCLALGAFASMMVYWLI